MNLFDHAKNKSINSDKRYCLECNNIFKISKREHNRGNSIFCNRKCSSRFSSKLRSPDKTIRDISRRDLTLAKLGIGNTLS